MPESPVMILISFQYLPSFVFLFVGQASAVSEPFHDCIACCQPTGACLVLPLH